MSDRVTLIEQRLWAALEPERLTVADDSATHAGHAGAKEGGHFTVHIVSSAFAGKTPVQRHRLVNAAVADLMHREIHALSIRAWTPEEALNPDPVT
ncbi:MAG: transcriptional regulator, BolA protein family [Proteobacteria bacterium]|jgi:BolA protein|nr:transcriptional regulator, BolA protein family [Pseudomonadota bacterium]MBS1225809.1 transcriptional regulator, BolA protein family [Pseudomonadota bacterium]MCU0806541.1 BolA family transcriptional regulator [Candidatus Contendobacter sp.]